MLVKDAHPIHPRCRPYPLRNLELAHKLTSSAAQLGLFLEELEYFMQQAQAEKDAIKNLTIPTMAEYRAMRRGVCTGISGVGVLLSLVQYVHSLDLNDRVDLTVAQLCGPTSHPSQNHRRSDCPEPLERSN